MGAAQGGVASGAMGEEVRCFVCANGNPVEPRLHYLKVSARRRSAG